MLVDTADADRTRASLERATGDAAAFDAWQAFYDRAARVARAVFPTMLEPLVEPRRAARPGRRRRGLGGAVRAADRRGDRGGVRRRRGARDRADRRADRHLRGRADASLRQNRCFLYHVIGNGTGAWDVPVGGMGALTDELAALRRERRRGARDRRRGHRDRGRRPAAPSVRFESARARVRECERRRSPAARPPCSTGCSARRPTRSAPEGAQLKVNMLLTPAAAAARSAAVPPEDAFAGTFHVNETYTQLESAFAEAQAGARAGAGAVRDLLPLADRPEHPRARPRTAHTLTLFALHTPARLFERDRAARTREVLAATLRVARLRARRADRGLPAARARTGARAWRPRRRSTSTTSWRCPRGNIFHRDLAWPFAEHDDEAGALGHRDGDRERPARRRRRAPRRRGQRHPRPQRGDGGA